MFCGYSGRTNDLQDGEFEETKLDEAVRDKG
jgi:hypothetical protein